LGFLIHDVSAQELKENYYRAHYDLESGLSQSVINDIKEDKKGFIWIATNDGLNRFDGVRFKVFSYEPSDSLSLPSSSIQKIFYDQDHHLWINTPDDLVIFDIESGKVAGKEISKKNKFRSVCIGQGQDIWSFTKRNTLIRLDRSSLKIKEESPECKALSNQEKIIGSYYINTSVLLFSKKGVCHEYNIETKKWSSSKSNLFEEELSYNEAVYDYQQTIYLYSMETDLIEYNLKTRSFSASPINSNERNILGINNVVYDSSRSELLISTYGQGCFIYNTKNKQTIELNQSSKNITLSSNYPQAILRGDKNILWIGYDGKGIDVFDPNIKKFVPLIKESPDEDYNLKFVRKIIEGANGNLWFGTAGSGLIEYDRKTSEYTFYNKNELKPNAETFIIEMEKVNNDIWLALNSGDILLFDMINKRVRKRIKYEDEWNEMGRNQIWSMYFDDLSSTLWIGTARKGIFSINTLTNEKKNYFDKSNRIYKDNRIRCLFQKADKSILAGTTKGALLLKPGAKEFSRVFPNKKVEINNQHSVKSFYEGPNGNTWVGTDGAGIFILDENYNTLEQITTDQNLSNNVVYGILSQDKSTVWVSSNKGLSNISWQLTNSNSISYSISNYQVTSGLQSNEFNTNSYLKLADGSLAFGGIDGVNIFNGNDIKFSKETPRVVIVEFSVFNRKMNDNKLISYTDEIDLKYNQNSFSFNYNAVGFNLLDKIKYQYRLIGLSDEWQDADDRTYVSFTNLDPGDYEFQVKAANYDGYWGEDYTTLKIHIAAPLHKQWWFIILCAFIILFTIWSIARYRNQVRTERESLKLEYAKDIAEVEMKALRAQINPHFLFNSLNSINNFILKNENKKARKYLVKFSQLVRNILNNSTSPYVSLKEEIETIQLYVEIESMRFDNTFKFNIEMSDDLDVNQIQIPSLLLQPYVENAIWHGLMHKEGEKNIEIRIHQSQRDLINIEIEDDGIGRIESQKLTSDNKRKSFGMQLGAERLKLMNSELQSQGGVQVIDLYNENKKAKGTLISIKLPILNQTTNKH
jgi:ligand-binding sensor domain-containing protein